MTIAVTAVSGQLGAAVVDALQDLGTRETIVGLARTPTDTDGLDVEVRAGDYDDLDQMTQSLTGVSALLLVSGNGDPRARIEQHRNVLGAATAAGVRKIVYTSVQGVEEDTDFSSIVRSNRQTEADVLASGMDWVIGRNGIYIEPDIESIKEYEAAGEVANSAGDGRVGYTTRPELAYAYARMLTDPGHVGQVYNLHGQPLTQGELTDRLNEAFGTQLVYRAMGVDEYRADRVAELGEFMGTVIAGIYENIRSGGLDVPSDYQQATGRPHQSWDDYFERLRETAT